MQKMHPILSKFFLSVMFFFVQNPVKMTSLEVSIVSLAQNVTTVEGDEVVLRCSVHNMGAHQQIIWRRGFEVVTCGVFHTKCKLYLVTQPNPTATESLMFVSNILHRY